MSSFGQRVALWPDLPHEKHFTSDQSRWTGRCLNSCLGIRSLFWKVCDFDPNLFGSCVSGKAGFIAAILSLKRCAILSNIDGSGAFIIVLTPRLSISTTLLSSALVSSTERSGLFSPRPYCFRFLIYRLDHISRVRNLWLIYIPCQQVRVTFPNPASVHYVTEWCIRRQTVQMST